MTSQRIEAGELTIRDAISDDAAAVAEIYNHYIRTSHATFELETIDAGELRSRIDDTREKGLPFLVGERAGQVIGYAYGRPFRPRPGYRFAVEIAVYVDLGNQSSGVATALYDVLIPQLFEQGVHSLIATIALPNEASVRLHEKFGFVKFGELREVGRKFDRWVDVGYWQLLHESSGVTNEAAKTTKKR
jgi:phosphinothricin acetyltransferase